MNLTTMTAEMERREVGVGYNQIAVSSAMLP